MLGMTRSRRTTSLTALAASAVLFVACGDTDADVDSFETGEPVTIEPGETGPINIADVGFDVPESVVHDEAEDIYLVSNIGGDPIAKANNGFISRVAPSGEVVDLRWIAGGVDGVTLHAPKGLVLKGDSLFVTDVDSLRVFDRRTGAPLGARGAPGAAFLNDPALGPDGAIYVTDTGLRAGADGLEPDGTDAVFRFGAEASGVVIASGPDLQNPNGILVEGSDVLIVPFGGTEIYRLDASGQRTVVAELPSDQLDGLIRAPDGSLLVSSWGGQAIYRVDPAGTVTTVTEGISSPADLGYDTTRGRLLIPVFTEDRLIILPM